MSDNAFAPPATEGRTRSNYRVRFARQNLSSVALSPLLVGLVGLSVSPWLGPVLTLGTSAIALTLCAQFERSLGTDFPPALGLWVRLGSGAGLTLAALQLAAGLLAL